MEHLSFPNESAEYRTARNALLDAEIALRRPLEAVAPQRRSPPPGGEIAEDYVFEQIGAGERPEPVRLSELFGEHPSILLSSFMYGPERDQPCDGCMQPPIPCPNSTPAGSPCPPAVLYSNRVQPCSVTVALQMIEGRGLVESRRGEVVIRDRKGLIDLANGSYGAPEAEYRRLVGEIEIPPQIAPQREPRP